MEMHRLELGSIISEGAIAWIIEVHAIAILNSPDGGGCSAASDLCVPLYLATNFIISSG